MSTPEEDNPPPIWLQKLEEQRERRLKVRLGHEAGAGAKCQKCEDKCPGLDLHFWRKICKICKCGKEDHDVNDEDIYGFVQFQLLGSRPVKSKGLFLKDRKDEVILEWTPKGSSNDVKKYLDELPADMLPIKGTEGAKIRKQRLQKQMPAHDIDASLCHQLTDGEVKEMEEYVSHIRKNCVGQGKIVRLSLFKGSHHQIPPSNQQILSQVVPNQVASSQNVLLQSSDLANNLQNLNIRDKNFVQTLNPQNIHQITDHQNPTKIGKVTDLNYSTCAGQNVQNVIHPLTTSNVERHQEQFELQNANFDYSNYAPNFVHPIEQRQMPTEVGQLKDIKYPDKINKTLLKFNPNFVNAVDENQIPTQFGQPKDINYSVGNVEGENVYRKANIDKINNPLAQFNPNFVSQISEEQLPTEIGHPKNIKYPTFDGNLPPINNATHPLLGGPQNKYPTENIVLPTQFGGPRDIKYPNNANKNYPNYGAQIENMVYPTEIGALKDINYPNPVNANPVLNNSKYKDNNFTSGSQNPIQLGTYLGDFNVPNRPPILEAQNLINPLEALQNFQSVGYIHDINYPSAKTDLSPICPADPNSNQNIQKCHGCGDNFQDGAVAVSVERTDEKWHPKCFVCGTCKQPLVDLVYFYHKETDNIYCGRDYAVLKGIPRCQACDELIFVREYCLAEENTFHVKHFCCYECDVPLAGKQYILENNQPVCIDCYENLKAECCQKCQNKIKPDEQGVSLQNLHWHANDDCFVCKKCEKSLLGGKILLKNQQLFCSDVCFKSYLF